MRFLSALLLLSIITSWHCASDKNASNLPAGENLTLEYDLVRNQMGDVPAEVNIRLINNSTQTLPDSGWAIYFSQIIGPRPDSGSLKTIAFENLDGDFFRFYPLDSFDPLPPGETHEITFTGSGFSSKMSEAPSGVYIVYQNEAGEELEPQSIEVNVVPYTEPEQILKGAYDQQPLQTPKFRYGQNAYLTKLPEDQVQPIVPTPVNLSMGEGSFTLDETVTIHYRNGLEIEANALEAAILTVLENPVAVTMEEEKEGKYIALRVNPEEVEGEEAYQMTITENNVDIIGGGTKGVFYGIQSLRQLFPATAYAEKQTRIELPVLTVEDAPRFGYRGVHLDVSRNFHSKETVLKLLDLMALYKLNKFHFHLTDDEGWRLEIPGLPELTAVGARRGHTLTEEEMLQPAYGSGPFADASLSYGTGFYTKAEYIEILKHARSRNIEVIPEIDVPGHARAAIISMKNRYRRLMAAGETEAAEEYLLHDPDDQSKYRSVQNYPDNVLNVCRESTYRFLEKVFDEIISMHEEAGVPLQMLHVGSDEVPEGVWENSPLCQPQIDEDDGVNTKDELTDGVNTKDELTFYFLERVDAMLDERNVRLAGWEEIVLKRDIADDGSVRYEPNPDFADDNFLPYIWNNLGDAVDLSYRLANEGYDVVLCNVTNFYFDLAYNNDPQEPGLYWGGYVDTKMAYRFMPFDVFASTRVNAIGQPTNVEELRRTKEQLEREAREHILGIQAQLWTETNKGQEMLEYYLFPKILGLAERAWADQPDWATIDNVEQQDRALDTDWNIFANALGQKQLPLLDHLHEGVNYRLPLPGAVIEEGMLKANVAYPGLEIRYTTDGSEPTVDSPLYTEPVEISGTVKLKTFSSTGRSSRVSEVSSGLEN